MTAHLPVIQSCIHFYLFGENLKEFWKSMKELKQKSKRILGTEEILKEVWKIFERILYKIRKNFVNILKEFQR